MKVRVPERRFCSTWDSQPHPLSSSVTRICTSIICSLVSLPCCRISTQESGGRYSFFRVTKEASKMNESPKTVLATIIERITLVLIVNTTYRLARRKMVGWLSETGHYSLQHNLPSARGLDYRSVSPIAMRIDRLSGVVIASQSVYSAAQLVPAVMFATFLLAFSDEVGMINVATFPNRSRQESQEVGFSGSFRLR